MLNLYGKDNKIRKEENLELLQKLSQNKVDTQLLQSSRHLGKRKRNVFLSDLRQDAIPTKISPARLPRAATFESDDDQTSGGDDDEALVVGQEVPVGTINSSSDLTHPSAFGKDQPLEIPPKSFLDARDVLGSELSWEGFESDKDLDGTEIYLIKGMGETSSRDTSSDMSDYSQISSEGDSHDSSADDMTEKPPGRHLARPTIRNSAFKSWANQQINNAAGFIPTQATQIPHIPAKDPLPKPPTAKLNVQRPEINEVGHGSSTRKVFSVPLIRSPIIESARLELPVVAEEQKIMEAIHANPIVIVSGDTGSGKTTQVPQFLFEAGYGNPESSTPGMIGVTQPRRVAAVSMSQRVAEEMGDVTSKVGYQIRFDASVSSKTVIKFMTDGILLREISKDLALTKYSIIVIDEAHERSVNTDILIGMLSRVVPLREKLAREEPKVTPLKLVIMSATLREDDFLQNEKLFPYGTPPVATAEGRQYPVTVHFARRTRRDYLEETFQKVCKGHRKLPPGAFLVFLTGQNEIRSLQKRLESTLRSTTHTVPFKTQVAASEFPLEIEDLEIRMSAEEDSSDAEGSDVEFVGYDDGEDAEFDVGEAPDGTLTAHILPLYSQLPTKDQLRVFAPPPPNSRLIVLATNVAETSLTIPGIRFVFDCGRSKQKKNEESTGILSYQTDWISKASASQRSGRAGRTGPGHCYRLYSSAVYENDFLQHTVPEILQTPIEGVVLQLKSLGIENILGFPFPTNPTTESLSKAERLLKNLGALSSSGQVTKLGRDLPKYPLSPRLAKMLVQGATMADCLPFVIAMVAALAVGEIFVAENQLGVSQVSRHVSDGSTSEEEGLNAEKEQLRRRFAKAQAELASQDKCSDAIKMLTAVCAYSYEEDGGAFCEKKFLRAKELKEASQLRVQLMSIVHANLPSQILNTDARLPIPSSRQLNFLKELVTAGYIDQIAIRADLAPVPPEFPVKPKRAIDVPYLSLIPLASAVGSLLERAIFIHPSSILARSPLKRLPQYLVYSHLHRSGPSMVGGQKVPKIRMFPLTETTGNTLTSLADGTPLISYGKPIGKIVELGGTPALRECWVVPSLTGQVGTTGWPLPARKVLQRKDPKAGWVVEKFLT